MSTLNTFIWFSMPLHFQWQKKEKKLHFSFYSRLTSSLQWKATQYRAYHLFCSQVLKTRPYLLSWHTHTSLWPHPLCTQLHCPFSSWKSAGSLTHMALVHVVPPTSDTFSFIRFIQEIFIQEIFTGNQTGDTLINQTRPFHTHGACILIPFPSSFCQANSSMSFRSWLNQFFLP